MFKVCQVCGNNFWTARPDTLYCSTACRSVALRDRSRRQAKWEQTHLDGEDTRRLVLLSDQYPKVGKVLHQMNKEHGAAAVRLALAAIEIIESEDYHAV